MSNRFSFITRRMFAAGALASTIGVSGAPLLASGQQRRSKRISIDAGRQLGQLKDLQGVNKGPQADWKYADLRGRYREMRISQVRTHDFFHAFDIDSVYKRANDPHMLGDNVPIQTIRSIFPDPTADPSLPESYNFAVTDAALRAILDCGAMPYFRVGRSGGSDNTPPPDPAKYAEIVRHVVRHYTKGWASGFNLPIHYWEIWNEPDLATPFWGGTPEQFYSLYRHTARAIKEELPNAAVGGPGIAFGLHDGPYRTAFVRWCRDNRAPLDFYSWHCYTNATNNPFDSTIIAQGIRSMLDANGFPKAESHLTEWSYSSFKADPTSILEGTYRAAAIAYMQTAHIDRAMHYHGQAIFGPKGEHTKSSRAFVATGMMLDTPKRLASLGSDDKGFVNYAGRSDDGRMIRVLIANYETPPTNPMEGPPGPPRVIPPDMEEYYRSFAADIPPTPGLPFKLNRYVNNRAYSLNVSNLGWGGGAFTVTRYRLDGEHDLVPVETFQASGNRLSLRRSMPPPSVEIVEIKRT